MMGASQPGQRVGACCDECVAVCADTHTPGQAGMRACEVPYGTHPSCRGCFLILPSNSEEATQPGCVQERIALRPALMSVAMHWPLCWPCGSAVGATAFGFWGMVEHVWDAMQLNRLVCCEREGWVPCGAGFCSKACVHTACGIWPLAGCYRL